jgi:hypothetical protein
MDDADLYGSQLVSMLRDLAAREGKFCFAFAAKAGRMDDICDAIKFAGEPKHVEFAVPNLSDDDVTKLIEVLDRANRLGKLNPDYSRVGVNR